MQPRQSRLGVSALVLLVGSLLASCTETRFVPPSPDMRQHLGKVAAVALSGQPSSILGKPVSGAGSGALMGAGQAAGGGLVIAGGMCESADPYGCALGLVLGGAVAIVAAPFGAIAGAINARSDKEVAGADSSLRAALADVKASEELRNRIVSAARAATPYDLMTSPVAAGPDLNRNLAAAGFKSELDVTVSDLGLSLAGRIDPDATLFIVAEARLRHVADGSELYRRKWGYVGVARNYFKMAAGNAAILRSDMQAGLDKLGERIASDLFVSNLPELKQGSPGAGAVFTVEAPTLENAAAVQAPTSSEAPVPRSAAGTAIAGANVAAAPGTPAEAVDVPFKIDLQGQSHDGVGKLSNGRFTGQVEYGSHRVVLMGDIQGDKMAVEVRGALNTRAALYPGDNDCSAEGSISPAKGEVSLPLLASCGELVTHVTLYLDLPPPSG